MNGQPNARHNYQESIVTQVSSASVTVLWANYVLESENQAFYSGCETEHVLYLWKPKSSRPSQWSRFGLSQERQALGTLGFVPAHTEYFTEVEEANSSALGQALSCRIHPDAFLRYTKVTMDQSMHFCAEIHSPSIMKVMEHMLQEVSEPGLASDIVIDSLGTIAMVEVARFFKSRRNSEEASSQRLSSAQINRIRGYIEGLTGPGATVKDLADLCDVSCSHFSRLFRNTTGQSPHTYVEAIRTSMAKDLLADTDLSIKQIAYRMGFSAPSGFIVAFRRSTQETPIAYRKRMAGR